MSLDFKVWVMFDPTQFKASKKKECVAEFRSSVDALDFAETLVPCTFYKKILVTRGKTSIQELER